MKRTALILIAIAALGVLAGSMVFASAYNVTLSPVGNQGVSGLATTLSGNIMGSNPYTNLEIDASMSAPPPANMVYEGWLVNSAQNVRTILGAFGGSMLTFRAKMVSFGANSPYDTIAVSLEPANSTSLTPTTIVAQGSLPGTMLTASTFNQAVRPAGERFLQASVMQGYKLTGQQIADLRMQGWSYPDIAMVANAAMNCPNATPASVSSELMQGETWSQIATSCSTTPAALLNPNYMGMTSGVAGTMQSVGNQPMMTGAYQPMVPVLVYYKTYGNGQPIVTSDVWNYWQRRGYSWQDVAIAANIASMTGDDLETLLHMTRVQGMTWRDVAVDKGINPDVALDTSQWPFSRGGSNQVLGTMQSTGSMSGQQSTMYNQNPAMNQQNGMNNQNMMPNANSNQQNSSNINPNTWGSTSNPNSSGATPTPSQNMNPNPYPGDDSMNDQYGTVY
jgi:hypothetical protein